MLKRMLRKKPIISNVVWLSIGWLHCSGSEIYEACDPINWYSKTTMSHNGTNDTLDRRQSPDGTGSGTVRSETLNRLGAYKAKLLVAVVLLVTLVLWLFASFTSRSLGLFDSNSSNVKLLVKANGGAWLPPRDLRKEVYAITREGPEHNYFLEIRALPASDVVRKEISDYCDVHVAINRIFLNDGEELICLDYDATEKWRRSDLAPVGNMPALHMLENNGNILVWKDLALCGIDGDGITTWEYKIGRDYPSVVCTKDSQYIYMVFPTKIVVLDARGKLLGRATGGFNSREFIWAIDMDGNLIAARLYQYDYQGIIQKVETIRNRNDDSNTPK